MAECEADIETGLLFSDGSEDVLQQLDDISIKVSLIFDMMLIKPCSLSVK